MYMLTLLSTQPELNATIFLINDHPTHISNINNNEKHSLNEHAKDNSVTIKEADKGGAIVLFNTNDYISSCENLLSDATN